MSKRKTNKLKKAKSESHFSGQFSSATAADIGRGKIKDNFLAALVTSKIYKMQVVKAKKGKGAYQRKDKHSSQGRESYLMTA